MFSLIPCKRLSVREAAAAEAAAAEAAAAWAATAEAAATEAFAALQPWNPAAHCSAHAQAFEGFEAEHSNTTSILEGFSRPCPPAAKGLGAS